MTDSPHHILEADSVGLCLRGKQILRDVYLRIESGKTTVLSGPNGAGKSSLFRIIFGTQKPSQGNIRLDGMNTASGERSSFIKYLPQFHYIPPCLKIGRIFEDYSVSLNEFIEVFPEIKCTAQTGTKEMSGGELRLLETFIILKSPSLFCILDEPFSYVAPIMAERLKAMIRDEAETNNKGILIADHLHQAVSVLADSAYIIRDGNIYTDDTFRAVDARRTEARE